MDSGTPYLSIVATARNDNHGGDLIRRMQVFVDGVLEQCRRHELPAELILVEWNPPADRPRLADALRWSGNRFCAVRIIEVPHNLHRRFKHSDRLPLYQMIAKNVGIRRARGEFILATNVDIILSDELMRFLVSKGLKPGYMYRADRFDVGRNVPVDAPLDEQLDYCRNHMIRVNYCEGTLEFRKSIRMDQFPPLSVRRLNRRVGLAGFRLAAIMYYLAHLTKYRQRIKNHWRAFRRENGFGPEWTRMHVNACGDFTLQSKKDWMEIQGYPELEMFSLHIDALFCYMEHYAGGRQVILDMPIYHIEHDGGWSPQVERDQSLNNRLDTTRIARITDEQLEEWGRQMERERRPIAFNGEGWGLADVVLPEQVLDAGAAVPASAKS